MMKKARKHICKVERLWELRTVPGKHTQGWYWGNRARTKWRACLHWFMPSHSLQKFQAFCVTDGIPSCCRALLFLLPWQLPSDVKACCYAGAWCCYGHPTPADGARASDSLRLLQSLGCFPWRTPHWNKASKWEKLLDPRKFIHIGSKHWSICNDWIVRHVLIYLI